jgi:hypothetical protein
MPGFMATAQTDIAVDGRPAQASDTADASLPDDGGRTLQAFATERQPGDLTGDRQSGKFP